MSARSARCDQICRGTAPHSWFTTNRDLPEFVGPTISMLKGMLLTKWSMTMQYMCWQFCLITGVRGQSPLVLRTEELPFLYVQLRVGNHKDVAVHNAGPFQVSLELQLDPVFHVEQLHAASCRAWSTMERISMSSQNLSSV